MNQIEKVDLLYKFTGLKFVIVETFQQLQKNRLSILFDSNKISLIGINFSDKNISNIEFLQKFKELEMIIAKGNYIDDLYPLTILDSLEFLDMSVNCIQDIAPISILIKLKHLDLSGNLIENINPIENLNLLENLNLSRNEISIVNSISKLMNLKDLHLASNKIENIIPIIDLLRTNTGINWNFIYNNNLLEQPPKEMDSYSRNSILDWYEAKKQKLEEIKIILIGDPKSGKTSLLRRLVYDDFNFYEAQTDGINIEHLSFNKSRIFDNCNDLQSLTGHFWDFGGQEIMNSTHQLFLTNRTVYILVLDARNDADVSTQIRLWLKKIKSTGGESPVIIVGNQIDINSAFGFVNSYDLKKEFKQIKAFVKVSCKTKVGLNELAFELDKVIPFAELFNLKIDERWIDVKKSMESITDKDFFLSEDDFNRICTKYCLLEKEAKKDLIKFLHDLGLVLHFDEFNLSEYYVLNPYWITYGLYQILTSNLVASQKGHVFMTDLDYIINLEKDKEKLYVVKTHKKITYSTNQRRFLADILCQFKLSFYMPDHNSFIIPDLLDTDEPLDKTKKIRFETTKIRFGYNYSYLPKSILPAIMVELNSILHVYWRTGCILKWNNCEALITSYENILQIEIIGDKKRKREFLGAIRLLIDNVNMNLTDQPLTFIPKEINNYEFKIGYNELLQREENREIKLTIYHPFKVQLVISELLDGIPSYLDNEMVLIHEKLDQIINSQKNQEELLEKQVDSLYTKALLDNSKNEIFEFINDKSNENSNLIIKELTDWIYYVTNEFSEEIDDKLLEIINKLKNTDKDELKFKISLPLIKLLGIDLEYKVDIKKWAKEMKVKYQEKLFLLLYT